MYAAGFPPLKIGIVLSELAVSKNVDMIMEKSPTGSVPATSLWNHGRTQVRSVPSSVRCEAQDRDTASSPQGFGRLTLIFIQQVH